jgi:WXG100 family type VII secretion target
MKASEIRVQYDDLATIAITLDRRVELTHQLLKALRRQQSILDGGVWCGSGAQAFFTEMNSHIVPSMNGLIEALEQTAGTTRQIQELMQQAETDAAALFRGEGGALADGARSGGDDGDADNGTQSAKGGSAPPGTNTVSGGTPFARGAGDSDDISPNDVTQGQLGDCFLMASLAAVAQSNPDVIRNMIKDNGDGTYTVTFKINLGGLQTLTGKRMDDYYKEHGLGHLISAQLPSMYGPDTYITKEIVVKPDFPANSSGQPLYAQFGDSAGGKPEIWVPLIEKAYAQMRGDYSDMNGGHAFNALPNITGKQAMRFSADDIKIDELADFHAKGNAIVVDTPDYTTQAALIAKATGRFDIVPNHSYYVAGVDKTAGTVTLRNPWGWHEKPVTMPLSEFGAIFKKGTITPTR